MDNEILMVARLILMLKRFVGSAVPDRTACDADLDSIWSLGWPEAALSATVVLEMHKL